MPSSSVMTFTVYDCLRAGVQHFRDPEVNGEKGRMTIKINLVFLSCSNLFKGEVYFLRVYLSIVDLSPLAYC